MSEEEKSVNDEMVAEDETVAEEVQNEKKDFVAWIKSHKTQLILAGISVPTIISVVLGLKNKDAIKALWKNLSEGIKEANMYSPKWFETATDDVLNAEREKVRVASCSSGGKFSETDILQKLLLRFDDEIRKRD